VNAPKRVKVTGDLYHGVVPEGAIYVGRAAPGLSESPFSNPHRVGKPCRQPGCGGCEHTRAGVIVTYRRYLARRPELVQRARRELAGRDLACWCAATEQCHADVLLAVVAGEEP
jgi:Domain of unknown function (DUF4326)